MEISSTFTYTNARIKPVISACSEYIAYVSGSRLVVRLVSNLTVSRVIELGDEFARKLSCVRWDNLPCQKYLRLAVASIDQIRVYIREPRIDESVGSIDRSGPDHTLSLGALQISDVRWISQDYDSVRLVIFSSLSISALIWTSFDLRLPIDSPKSSSLLQELSLDDLAIICRIGVQDILQIFNSRTGFSGPGSKTVLENISDCQSVKWSVGKDWFVAVENPSMGYKVNLYSCAGHFIRSYFGPYQQQQQRQQQQSSSPSLRNDTTPSQKDFASISQVLWLRNKSTMTLVGKEMLILADYEEQIVFLDLLKFVPQARIKHGRVLGQIPVWLELKESSISVEYKLFAPPFEPPRLERSSNHFTTISHLELSADSKLLASIVSSMPSVVWIWSVEDINDIQCMAVLSHVNAVKSIEWLNDNLLIVPANSLSVGIWRLTYQEEPLLIDLSGELDPEGIELLQVAKWASPFHILICGSRCFGIVNLRNHRSTRYQYEEENTEIERLRQGSPAIILDDDTKVLQLQASVQQSEWGAAATDMVVEDTFH